MRSPLLVLAGCFALGILAAHAAAPSPWAAGIFLALAGACLLAALIALRARKRWPAILATLGGFILAGLAAFALFAYRFTPPHVEYLSAKPAGADKPRWIEGMIASTPYRAACGTVFDLEVRQVGEGADFRRADGKIRIECLTSVKSGARAALDRLHLQYGECIRAPVRLYKPCVYSNPVSFDYRAWLASIQDIYWEGIITSPEKVSKRPGCHAPVVPVLIHKTRQRLLNAIDGLYPPWAPQGRDGAVLKAMLLGDRSALDSTTIENFRKSGLYHLLVIAGLHVGLLVAILYWLLQLLKLREVPRRILLVLFLIGYASLVEERAATMRATLMILAYLFGRFVYRERSPLNAVGFAALVLLVTRPAWLFEAGFQFSFAAALLIAGLTLPILSRIADPYYFAARELSRLDRDIKLEPKQAQFRLDLRSLMAAITRRSQFLKDHPRLAERFVTLPAHGFFKGWAWVVFCAALQVGVLLPMAAIFNRVTYVGFPLNIVALPVMTALLALAVPTVLLAAAVPALAVWPAKLLALVMKLLFMLTEIPRLPHWLSYRIPGPPVWVGCGFALALVAAALALGRRQSVFALSCAVTLVFALLISWCPFAPQIPTGKTEITALDCCGGESLFIVLPDKTTLLVDAGASEKGRRHCDPYLERWNPGENIVSPYLWSRRIKKIDTLVLTSASQLQGMAAIARNFRVKEFWYPSAALHNPDAVALLAEFDRSGIQSREMSAEEAALAHLRASGARLLSTEADGAVTIDLQGPKLTVRCYRAGKWVTGCAGAAAAAAFTFQVR